MGKSGKPLDGRFAYLHQKLGEAIRISMFRNDARTFGLMCSSLHTGFNNTSDTSPYLADEGDQRLVKRIKELIETNADDDVKADPRFGPSAVRWERMTEDERHEFADCIWNLYGSLSWLNVGA